MDFNIFKVIFLNFHQFSPFFSTTYKILIKCDKLCLFKNVNKTQERDQILWLLQHFEIVQHMQATKRRHINVKLFTNALGRFPHKINFISRNSRIYVDFSRTFRVHIAVCNNFKLSTCFKFH